MAQQTENNNMTAVEWLMTNIEKALPNFIEAWRVEFEQAKQMEKEQIIKAWINGDDDNRYSLEVLNKVAEQYYNETYGNP